MPQDPRPTEAVLHHRLNTAPGRWHFGLDRLILVMTVFCSVAVGLGYWIRTLQTQHSNPMGIVIYTLAGPSLLLLLVSAAQSIYRVITRYTPPT